MKKIETSPLITTAIENAFVMRRLNMQISIERLEVDEALCFPEVFPTLIDIEQKLFDCARVVEAQGRGIALLIPTLLGLRHAPNLFLTNRKTFDKISPLIEHISIEEPRDSWTALGHLTEEYVLSNGQTETRPTVELLVRDDLPDDIVYCTKNGAGAKIAEGAVAFLADGGFLLRPIDLTCEEFELFGAPHMVKLILN